MRLAKLIIDEEIGRTERKKRKDVLLRTAAQTTQQAAEFGPRKQRTCHQKSGLLRTLPHFYSQANRSQMFPPVK